LPSTPPTLPGDSVLFRLPGTRNDACYGPFYGLNTGKVSTPPDYRLGPADSLNVQLVGRIDIPGQNVNVAQGVTVDPEGYIAVVPIGTIHVAGLTVPEAHRKLTAEVRKLYRFTDVTLSIAAPRCFEVLTSGEVERPGTMWASAMRRVHEIISIGGGITPRGSVRYVVVTPRGGEPRTIDLLRFELMGDLTQNPLVEDGMRIHVPYRGGWVSLAGAVRRPGTYELGPDPGLRTLLDLVGGVSQGAAQAQARLTRIGPGDRNETFPLDLAKVLTPPADVPLKPGDVLYVPPGNVLQDVVEVRGAFIGTSESAKTAILGKPTIVQRFELATGDRVRDVLVKAGGPAPLADLRLAIIDRGGSGGPRRQIPIDLQKLLVEKDEFENIPLENGDVFTLPAVEDKVYVLGEIKSAGPQDYRVGATVREYLAVAGGPTVRGRFQNAVMTLRDGRTFNLAQAPPVEPGAIITIPEVSVRWWQDYVTISNAITGLITTYASLFLLFGGRITTTVNQ
jgi:protein involved in polysaccharide export with SLBB domain